MKKIGMIFPGQGSQVLGMCKDLYDQERIVQEYFEEASSCLDHNFVRLCFASSERELKETVNAQTSIFLVSSAIYALLKTKYEIVPDIVAGHSSGEYAAIFAADGMTFPDALYLLKKRSMFMDAATKTYPGTMTAVLGMQYEKLKEICDKYDDSSDNKAVAEIVNYNSPEQLVVSGTLPELDAITQEVKANKGKVIPLNVAGAFHSRLMKEAEAQFSLYMVKVDFKNLSVPLINNIEARAVTENEDMKNSLIKQMSSHVLWWPSMQHFKDCDIILEIGPSGKLSKALKREWPEKEIMSINTPQDFETLLPMLGKEVMKPEFEEEKEERTKKSVVAQPVAQPEVVQIELPVVSEKSGGDISGV